MSTAWLPPIGEAYIEAGSPRDAINQSGYTVGQQWEVAEVSATPDEKDGCWRVRAVLRRKEKAT